MTSSSTLDPGAILASVGEVAYEWNVESDALVLGTNAREVLKLTGDVPNGRAFSQLLDPDSRQARFEAIMRSAGQDGGAGVPYHLEYAFRPVVGGDTILWLEDTGRWFGRDGRPVRAHGLLRVVNERHEKEQQLAYLSRFDPLTGEMNRAHLTEILATTLDEAVQMRSSCGFMLVSIDGLARINEAYGYEVADELIAATAKRIRNKLRGQDHLGRYSGNKFGILLRNCTPDDMLIAAERVLAGMRDDVVPTQAGPIAVTITIGGVTAPRHARTVREVMSRAQEALDSAKARRRGSFQAYQPSVEREAQRRKNIRTTDEIIAALNERRIFPVYEPIVATKTRAPAFYECLLRVRRADGSLLPAQGIVPAAERLGLVRLLDHRVLEMVLEELIASPELRVSINVSPASTTDPDWWLDLGATLRTQPGVADRLTVEITETAAIHDLDETRGFVARVKDLGCRIAIDDFGAGYTSFRNLRKLGVDIIKIDGAFVQAITRSEDDRAFVHSMIDLAHRLRLETVAEWVQDEATAEMLAEWGCDYLQGALIGLALSHRPWRPEQSGDRTAASA